MHFFLLAFSFAMLSTLYLALDYSNIRSSAYAFDMIELRMPGKLLLIGESMFRVRGFNLMKQRVLFKVRGPARAKYRFWTIGLMDKITPI